MPSLRSPSLLPHRRSPYSSSDSNPDRRKKRHTGDIQSQRSQRSPSPHKRRKRHDEDYYENTRSYHQSSREHKDRRAHGKERDASLSDGDMEGTSKSQRHRSYDHKHKSSIDRRDLENTSRRYRDRSESPRYRHRDSYQRVRAYDLGRDRSSDRRRRKSPGRPRSQSPSGRSESQSPSRSRPYSHSHLQPRSHRREKREVSPSQAASPRLRTAVRSARPLPSQAESYKGTDDVVSTNKADIKEKEKPNFSTTGLLARETNAVSGTDIVLKYNEPPDARKPPSSQDWRLYIFKHSSLLRTITLRTRTCWLIGRELAVADIPVEHPSCSKQHAVIQFRHRATVNEFGDKDAKVRPYLIDLESSNGTLLNGEKIEASRYFEVRNGDVVKFGFSEREFVVMLPPKDI